MPIHFTDREMKRAWRENLSASTQSNNSNCFKLLLFYSVECGLKVLLMKRERKNFTENMPRLKEFGHNINKMLDELRVSAELRLPKEMYMKADMKAVKKRIVKNSEINQMWRYGGCASGDINDSIIEAKLIKISNWIKEQEGML
jgi:hypothetical protein